MNKAQLIEKVAAATQEAKSLTESVLDSFLNHVQNAVASGEEVKVLGFGTFLRSQRQARSGRNPQTGEEIKIPAARVPKFRPGKDFKDSIN